MRGASFSLTQEKYSLGRAEDCDVCISDPTISGHHCTLMKLDDDTYAIEDLGSTNGSKVNDQRLEQGQAVKLKNGDIIQIGNIEILFDDVDASREESRTVSVIDLDDIDTGEINKTTMRNLGNKFGGKRVQTLRPNASHNRIMQVIVALLALVGCVGVVMVIMKFLGK
ncbi:MAG: FHA domain-containing protein [Lentisphaeria bacterium]|nr:FHA domain-containing protein [Lentisphaeria bacterium]